MVARKSSRHHQLILSSLTTNLQTALSANTLAKVTNPVHGPQHEPTLILTHLPQVVNGMSDNLLTSVIRAWDTDATIDMKPKLILVAPAMNSVQSPLPILLLYCLEASPDSIRRQPGNVAKPHDSKANTRPHRRLGCQGRAVG